MRGFVDYICSDRLLEMLGRRINDRAFPDLNEQWPKAEMLNTDGQVLHPEAGTPRGGIVSPVLANAYLRETARPAVCRGNGQPELLIREAY